MGNGVGTAIVPDKAPDDEIFCVSAKEPFGAFLEDEDAFASTDFLLVVSTVVVIDGMVGMVGSVGIVVSADLDFAGAGVVDVVVAVADVLAADAFVVSALVAVVVVAATAAVVAVDVVVAAVAAAVAAAIVVVVVLVELGLSKFSGSFNASSSRFRKV